MEGKASFPVWEMENEEPRTLQSHKHEPPGKTVKQLFIGNTATQRAARPLEEKGWKTHTQQQQHNSFLFGGREQFICKDLGLQSLNSVFGAQVRPTMRAGGGGASNKTQQKEGSRKA